jgi:hypothetical protein
MTSVARALRAALEASVIPSALPPDAWRSRVSETLPASTSIDDLAAAVLRALRKALQCHAAAVRTG